MIQSVMQMNRAVLPGMGEDSFVLRREPHRAFLCVADGCGGMGSRRHEALGGHTEAFAASRLAAHVMEGFACEAIPALPQSGALLQSRVQKTLDHHFRACADAHCAQGSSRIVSTMQRRLPTTLCAAWVEEDAACFLWAGDSRAYVLDEAGLHQCTQDHVRGDGDVFDNLYRDPPLSLYLTADREAKLSMRRLPIAQPCIVITATDGAYGGLPTPMEMEMLLLDAFKQAQSWNQWERKLALMIPKAAQDDATLLAVPCTELSFEEFRERMLLRREALQKQFITPARRKKTLDFSREKWLQYRANYDWSAGGSHERDWRL